MSLGIAVPYITITDLNSVLDNAAEEKIIEKKTATALMNLTLDYRQEVIRKAQDQKNVNELRNRCLTLSASIYRSGIRRLETKRDLLSKNYITDKELLSSRHLANNTQIKEDFLAQRENCFRNIDMLRKLIENEGVDSEEGKMAAKKISSNNELIRNLKTAKEEQKVYELERYLKELSELKKKFTKDMEDIQRRFHNLHVDKTHAVQVIQQADEAKLPILYTDLMKLQPEYQKGGEL